MTASVEKPARRGSRRSDALLGLLGSPRWLRRPRPFPHVLAYNVFTPDAYRELDRAFGELMTSIVDTPYLEGHDVYGATIAVEHAAEFHPLLTRSWHDLLAAMFDVAATGHVACGLHHHIVGGADGFPHNDLNPGWFAADPGPGEVELSDPRVVEYTTGAVRRPGAEPREVVRAVAAIFFLHNGDWSPGDGGATGLYRAATDPIRRPVSTAPPLNNSLLAFECTPTSFHGFIGNRRRPRSSIVMWLHRPKSDVVHRWGAHAIVPYGRPSPGARQ